MRLLRNLLSIAAAFFLSGCISPHDPAPGLALEGTVWRLIEMNGKAVTATGIPEMRVPTLQLNPESHRASGISGVNRYSCGYELNGTGIKFGMVAGTRMAGSPDAMAVEGAYLSALSTVTSWGINREELVLKSAGKGLLHFRAE